MTATMQDTWINRVQGLIAKAESTEYPDEAEALMAKAQELMTRHAIDVAMLRARDGDDRGVPVVEQVEVPAPYAKAKSSLLAQIGQANSVEVVRHHGSPVKCSLVGFGDDVDATKTLFASMSLQAARAMRLEPVPRYENAKAFRNAFMLMYASRIGARMREAKQAVEDQAVAESDSVALVLASKQEQVNAALKERFPRVRTVRSQYSSRAGAAAGTAAANRAALGHRGVAGGNRALVG